MRDIRRVIGSGRVNTKGSGNICIDRRVLVHKPPACLGPRKQGEDKNNGGDNEDDDQSGLKRRRNDVEEVIRKYG